MELIIGTLTSMARKTAENMKHAPSVIAFIASRQWVTLGALPEELWNPEVYLLQEYVDEGTPIQKGPACTHQALEQAIIKGPDASTRTSEMTAFIRVEMRQHVWDGFNILLPAADAVMMFGDNLNMYHISAVPQEHCRPCLILNLS